MALDDILRKHEFFEHPFSTFIAEHESKLAEWFVPPPFISTLLGDTGKRGARLQLCSNLVFGTPGSGKTSLRISLERELLRREPRALVLRYVNFSNPLTTSSRPSLYAHVEELLLLGTIALIGYWHSYPECYAALTLAEKAELAGLAYRYYECLPPESKRLYTKQLSPLVARLTGVAKKGLDTLIEIYNTTINVLKGEKIERTEWKCDDPSSSEVINPDLRLQRFWSLASAMCVDSIWVLVDGVDEAPSVRTEQQIFDCVSELLLAQQVLEFRQDERQVLCFKFFLTRPDGVRGLLDKAGFRKDRVKTEILSWGRRDLDQMLKRRLAFYSNNKVLTFDQLCDVSAQGTHDRLLDESRLRPRTLFRMAHEIFAVMQRNEEKGVYLFDRTTVDLGIRAGLEAVVG